jgi:hypothetical protein
MELDTSDILHFVGYHRREVVKRLQFVLTSAVREIDYAQWDVSIRYTSSADGYGRMGCCFQFDNHYGLEWFFGIYYHPFDHRIPFKQAGEPELAFFLDMDPRYTAALRSQAPAQEACMRLTQQGFESNLYGELTSNPWRFLAHRTPLLQCGAFSIEAVAQWLHTLLQLVYAEQAFIELIKMPVPATLEGVRT